MDTVTSRLIKLREDHGLNKIEIAKKIGTNKSTITRYESGEMKPNLEAMLKIREAFGVSLDWIAGIDTNESAEYGSVVAECVKSDISPDDLSNCVELIKNTRRK